MRTRVHDASTPARAKTSMPVNEPPPDWINAPLTIGPMEKPVPIIRLVVFIRWAPLESEDNVDSRYGRMKVQANLKITAETANWIRAGEPKSNAMLTAMPA